MSLATARPTEAASRGERSVEAIYTDFHRWAASDFGKCTELDALTYHAEIRRAFGGGCATGLRVLEIGFGNGAFLGWCRDNGHAVTGIEINEAALERARAAGFAAFEDVEALPEGARFDLIAAFDVLEHLEVDRLLATLRSLRERLEPGGRIVARFPNGDSPFGLANQHGDLTHRTALGKGRVEQLALVSGLRLVVCDAPALPVVGAGVARGLKRLLVKAARRVVERVLIFLYLPGARGVTFDQNLVAVFARSGSDGEA